MPPLLDHGFLAVAVFLYFLPPPALPGRVRPGPLASTGLHVLLLVPGLHHSLWVLNLNRLKSLLAIYLL